MESLLGRSVVITLVLAAALFAAPLHSHSQLPAKRRVVERVSAPYPVLARNMALGGVVKVDALVGTDGIVKSVDIKGGHPVLAQAAATAVRQWKWEVAPHESHEVVEIKFAAPE